MLIQKSRYLICKMFVSKFNWKWRKCWCSQQELWIILSDRLGISVSFFFFKSICSSAFSSSLLYLSKADIVTADIPKTRYRWHYRWEPKVLLIFGWTVPFKSNKIGLKYSCNDCVIDSTMQYNIVVVHGEMWLSFLLSSFCSCVHGCNSCHSSTQIKRTCI